MIFSENAIFFWAMFIIDNNNIRLVDLDMQRSNDFSDPFLKLAFPSVFQSYDPTCFGQRAILKGHFIDTMWNIYLNTYCVAKFHMKLYQVYLALKDQNICNFSGAKISLYSHHQMWMGSRN